MQKVEEFGNSSSIHGIKYILILKSSKTKRIFWLLAILFSFFGFFYYIRSAYNKLMYDPETVMKASDRSAFDFPAPAITICPNLFAKDNIVHIPTFQKNMMHRASWNLSTESCRYYAANFHWCDPGHGKLLDEPLCRKKDFENFAIVKLMMETASTMTSLLNGCLLSDCTKEIRQVLTDRGICFTRNSLSFSSIFNTKEIHDDFKCYLNMTKKNKEDKSEWSTENGYKSSRQNYPERAKKGIVYSFEPRIKINELDNMCGSGNYRIYLHKPNEISTPSHFIEYLNTKEELELKFVLKSHKTDRSLQRFAPKIRKCYFEGEKKLKFFKNYSKALCEWECLANTTLHKLNCSKYSYPRDNFTRICNFTDYNFLKIKGLTLESCDCFPPCIDIEYSYKLLRTKTNAEDFKKHEYESSKLHISIDSEFVVEIENNVAYKLQNYFGGLLGLFMGCSLLSVIEVFYFLMSTLVSLGLKFHSKKYPNVWATKTFHTGVTSAKVEPIAMDGNNKHAFDLETQFHSLKNQVLENQNRIHNLLQRIEKLEQKY